MPIIRPSSDLRNSYSEISDYCHAHDEVLFLTRNGYGDLAVMSIEKYEKIMAILEEKTTSKKKKIEPKNIDC